jgi:hypothetical protein
MRRPKPTEAKTEVSARRATAADLRESNNPPSPVAKFIHRAASNVLAKGACLNNLGTTSPTPAHVRLPT